MKLAIGSQHGQVLAQRLGDDEQVKRVAVALHLGQRGNAQQMLLLDI